MYNFNHYNKHILLLPLLFHPVAYRGRGLGCSNPAWNSEGPPKLCHTQPDCENC